MIRAPHHAATAGGITTRGFGESLDFCASFHKQIPVKTIVYKCCIDFVKCIIGIRVLTRISLWDGTDRTLVGLAAPSLSPSIETGVEGVDLTPLFVQPASAGPHNASYSQMARCPCGRAWPCTVHGIESACNSVPRNVTPFMGYTVRFALQPVPIIVMLS